MDEEWDIDDLMEPETPNPFAKKSSQVKKGKGESFQYEVLGHFYDDGGEVGRDYQKLSKGREAHVEMMSPKKYFDEIGQDIDHFSSGTRDADGYRDNIEQYKKAAQRGDKFAMPWIEYKEGKYDGQEGRHRAAMAHELGVERMPVVVVNQDRERFHDHIEWGEVQEREYNRKKRQNPFTFEEDLI